MQDIFVSYKKEDAERVRVLVEALERSGFSVWWDRTIPPGSTWAEVIEGAITGCRCVVVVWSEKSVGSEWVHKEARKGEGRRNLIPAMIDKVQPPFEFEHIQAANLVGWDGSREDPQYEMLVERIEAALLAGPGEEAGAAVEAAERRQAERSRGRVMRRSAAVAAVLLSLVAVAVLLFLPSHSVQIELSDLRLSGVRFELAAEERGTDVGVVAGNSDPVSVLVLEEMPVEQIQVDGLLRVEVPASAGRAGQTHGGEPAVELVKLSESSRISLSEIELPVDTMVELRKAGSRYQLSVRGASERLKVDLTGPVRVSVAGVYEEDSLDFDPPRGLLMYPSASSLLIDFQPPDSGLPVFSNLAIDDLRLYRVDQAVGLDETTVDLVSTIEGGRLDAAWLGQPLELSAGYGLRFDSFQGEINSLRLLDDAMVLNARGTRVTGLRRGLRGEGENLMPTLLGSLSLTGKLVSALIALAYLGGLLTLVRHLWRRSI